MTLEERLTLPRTREALLQAATWLAHSYIVLLDAELEAARALEREGLLTVWCDVNGPLPIWKGARR